MSLMKQFRTSKEAESNGKWIHICDNEDGTVCRFLIVRAGHRNKAYTKLMEKLTRPYRAIIDKLDTKTDDTITATALSETVVIGWENVQDETGVDIPFSKEKAKELLVQLPDLMDTVNKAAWSINTFREQELEDEAKN